MMCSASSPSLFVGRSRGSTAPRPGGCRSPLRPAAPLLLVFYLDGLHHPTGEIRRSAGRGGAGTRRPSGVVEPLARVLPQRLEHLVSRRAGRCPVGDEHRLRHQTGDRVDDVPGVDVRRRSPRWRRRRRTWREHAEPVEDQPLGLARATSTTSRPRRAASGGARTMRGARRSAAGTARRDASDLGGSARRPAPRPARWRAECRRAAGRSRRPPAFGRVERELWPTAAARSTKSRAASTRTSSSSAISLSGSGQRAQTDDLLAGTSERFAAGGQYAHMRAPGEKLVDELGRGVEQVLAVVQQHEQRRRTDELDDVFTAQGSGAWRACPG